MDFNSDEPDSACRTDCQLPKCGDLIIDPRRGETCEPPNAKTGCTDQCQLSESSSRVLKPLQGHTTLFCLTTHPHA